MSKKKEVSEVITELKETDQQQRIKDLEDKLRQGEERSLERVCKALGIDPETVKAKEASVPKEEDQVRMHVHYPIRVNSQVFQGDVTVPISTARVIQQALGDRRMRLLRELTGDNFILKEIQGIGFVPQLVGRVDIAGDKVAV